MSALKVKPVLTISLMMVIVLGMAACGGTAKASHKSVDVQVTLNEFTIDSSITEFTVGVPYHFTITNNGASPHEFEIMPPVSGQVSPEQIQQMELAGTDKDQLPAGGSITLDYTFTQAYPSGTMEFSCHLPGHYESGMHTPIVVNNQ